MSARSATRRSIDQAIGRIKEVNINFLAIDFDQTFIDIHTGGRWPGTLHELIAHVRPEFRDLVVRACVRSVPSWRSEREKVK